METWPPPLVRNGSLNDSSWLQLLLQQPDHHISWGMTLYMRHPNCNYPYVHLTTTSLEKWIFKWLILIAITLTATRPPHLLRNDSLYEILISFTATWPPHRLRNESLYDASWLHLLLWQPDHHLSWGMSLYTIHHDCNYSYRTLTTTSLEEWLFIWGIRTTTARHNLETSFVTVN